MGEGFKDPFSWQRLALRGYYEHDMRVLPQPVRESLEFFHPEAEPIDVMRESTFAQAPPKGRHDYVPCPARVASYDRRPLGQNAVEDASHPSSTRPDLRAQVADVVVLVGAMDMEHLDLPAFEAEPGSVSRMVVGEMVPS